MLTWKRTKFDGIFVYNAQDEYDSYEIRSWAYDESGEGRFQLCKNGYHVANFKTLTDAKNFAENDWS